MSALVDSARLEAVINPPPTPRRLNVASGNHPSGAWGWDVDLWFGADVRADVRRLPFPDAAFEAAYMGQRALR